MIHGTPDEVVSILKKHIPRSATSFLEPAVGEGALLVPIISGKYTKISQITAFDINSDRIKLTKLLLSNTNIKFNLKNVDFLESRITKQYDCVLMNPPFNAKRQDFVIFEGEKMPSEAAFLRKAIGLLSPKAKLIAILPSSIITGDALTRFRRNYLDKLKVEKVYELDHFAFPKIEGKFYILVASQGKSRRDITFEKSYSNKTVSIKVPWQEVYKNNFRLDFSFYFSQIKLLDAIKNSGLIWCPMKDLAYISRGKVSAPFIQTGIIHTHNYLNHTWLSPDNPESIGVLASKGDILAKRVSRNCQDSFGIYRSNQTAGLSDCVFKIRAKRKLISPTQLLFSIRSIYSSSIGKQLLVRGTGANFITQEALLNIQVPINLHKKYQKEYRSYKNSINKNSYQFMESIESKINADLFN